MHKEPPDSALVVVHVVFICGVCIWLVIQMFGLIGGLHIPSLH